jgi:G3E family GTPase
MTHQTLVTLVTGSSSSAREAKIAELIFFGAPSGAGNSNPSTAVILEGMSDGIDRFASAEDHSVSLSVTRIAPGCPCCIGNLTMRVTLNRILRHSPDHLFISLAQLAHVETFRVFLAQHPYKNLLKLTKDIHV